MVERRTRTHVLTWVGLGALAAVGYAIGVPLALGGAALFPIAVATYDGGVVEVGVTMAAGVLGVALMETTLSLPAIGLFGAGALLGVGLRPQRRVTWIYAAAVLAIFAVVGIQLLPTGLGGSAPISPQMFAKDFGLSLHLVRQVFKQAEEILPIVVPLYAAVIALEAFYMARWVLGSRGKTLQPVLPFSLWEAPTWLAPTFLAVFAVEAGLTLAKAPKAVEHWSWLAMHWVAIPLGMFGLAALNNLISRLHVPPFLRVAFLALMAVVPPYYLIPLGVGVLDNFMDFRRIRHTDK